MDKYNDEFLEVFKYLRKKKRPLVLMSVYKGLPVTSESPVLYIGGNSIIVKMSEYQTVCIDTFKQIYIKEDIFPRVIQADLLEMDLKNHVAAISNFRYVNTGIGERRHLRVSPGGSVGGIIKANSFKAFINGMLSDISRRGLSLIVDSEDLPGMFAQRGTEVTAFFTLPGINAGAREPSSPLLAQKEEEQASWRPDVHGRFANLEKSLFGERNRQTRVTSSYGVSRSHRYSSPEFGLLGKVIHTDSRFAQGRHRVGIQLSNTDASNTLVTKFVTRRQAEIIREIREKYDAMLNEEKQKSNKNKHKK